MNAARDIPLNGNARVHPIIAAFGATLMALSSLAWAESPVVEPVTKVTGGPSVQQTRGEIIPLLWRARIGKAVTAVPLAAIEHYGIQDYSLGTTALIRELTITTKSLSMIRIYHILPLGTIQEDAAKRLDEARKKAADSVSVIRSQDDDLPVKTYPVTTHEKMVEYQVARVEDIDQLYDSLDKAMVTYLGRDLSPDQRPRIGVTEAVGKSGGKNTIFSEPAPPEGEKPSE